MFRIFKLDKTVSPGTGISDSHVCPEISSYIKFLCTGEKRETRLFLPQSGGQTCKSHDAMELPMDRYIANLNKTLEIIDLCFHLKEAYFSQQFPRLSDGEIRRLIYKDILTRKEKLWKSERASLKH